MFVKGKSANPAGRPRGSVNKMTAGAKQAIEAAFGGIGGVTALTKWARRHPGDFFRLYARLIPNRQELTGKDGGTSRYALKRLSKWSLVGSPSRMMS